MTDDFVGAVKSDDTSVRRLHHVGGSHYAQNQRHSVKHHTAWYGTSWGLSRRSPPNAMWRDGVCYSSVSWRSKNASRAPRTRAGGRRAADVAGVGDLPDLLGRARLVVERRVEAPLLAGGALVRVDEEHAARGDPVDEIDQVRRWRAFEKIAVPSVVMAVPR